MSDGQQELVAAFVMEANEHLADMESELLTMEARGADIDLDLVNTVFRGIHSTKGTAGFLGFGSIASLAHDAENVLNLIRNRELVPTSGVVDALLRAVDALRGMVNNAESSNDVDVSELNLALATVSTEQTSEETQAVVRCEVDVALPTGEVPFHSISEMELVGRQRQGCHIYVVKVDLMADVQAEGITPVDFLHRLYAAGELIDSYVSTVGVGDLTDELPDALFLMLLVGARSDADELQRHLRVPREQIYHMAAPDQTGWGDSDQAPDPGAPTAANTTEGAEEPPVAGVEAEPEPTEEVAAEPAPAAPRTENGLRVPIEVLDALTKLARELVLARNQLIQVVGSKEHTGLDSVSARLDQITSELQEAIMQTRMQPVGTVFNRFTQVVRDLSGNLGRQCALTIDGKDVELDKTIIEAIGDPLTHLVRNAVDHGIEPPEQRTRSGKDPTGAIALRAARESGKVSISIRDDGRGIDGDALKEKAVAKGLITAEQARDMSRRETVRLIFHPGFSMAERAGGVSDRGAGMDVVKTNIEKIGGAIEIDTEVGVGTTVNIKLPLTLAIIPSLVVRSGDSRFAVPQVSISELLRIKADEVATRIERVKDAEVVRLRGNLLFRIIHRDHAFSAASYRTGRAR